MFNYLAPKTLARCEDGRDVYLTKLWDVFWGVSKHPKGNSGTPQVGF
jgi:hypothetical protein